MPKPVVIGNWKMNTTTGEAVELVSTLRNSLEGLNDLETILCPPFVSLALVSKIISSSSIKLGAQNMYYEDQGAYTGEISARMLHEFCDYVLLGHSERRRIFNENDDFVRRKIQSAINVGLRPILCVGENSTQRQMGQVETVITTQLQESLKSISEPKGLVIAYEPVWAIGTGTAATSNDASVVVNIIRRGVYELYGPNSEQIPILYGGSVTSNNVSEFVEMPNIDGVLVGSASLIAQEFLDIVFQTFKAKVVKGN
jgi:triosephosphate isomerase